jgi:predicted nucleic acid-binding Zn ribbon protein
VIKNIKNKKEESNMRCKYCGMENPEGFIFCGGCGHPLGRKKSVIRRRTSKWVLAFLVVLLMVVFIYCLYYFWYIPYYLPKDLVKYVNKALSEKYGKTYCVVTDKDILYVKYYINEYLIPRRKNNKYYPYIVKGDFDGDGKTDIAAIVKQTNDQLCGLGTNTFLAVFWGDEKGIKVYKNQEVSAISLLKYEDVKKQFRRIPLKFRADAIVDEIWEKFDYLLYWNGYSFKEFMFGGD